MNKSTVSRLVGSTKWVMVLGAIAAVAVVTATGNLESDQFVEFLKWALGFGVVGRAVEDGLAAKK